MVENDEPSIWQKSQSEKDASAYWFRQISTALALGNAGGIVTLAGFAGNADSLKLAALMTYPALSYFLTGVSFAFVAFALQFAYSTLRLEAYAELNERQIRWREERSLDPRINWLPTVVFFIYWPLQIAAISASGLYFYRGAAEVSGQAGALHCAVVPNSSACKSRPTIILDSPSEVQVGRVRSIPGLVESNRSDDRSNKAKLPEPAGKPTARSTASGVAPPTQTPPQDLKGKAQPLKLVPGVTSGQAGGTSSSASGSEGSRPNSSSGNL